MKSHPIIKFIILVLTFGFNRETLFFSSYLYPIKWSCYCYPDSYFIEDAIVGDIIADEIVTDIIADEIAEDIVADVIADEIIDEVDGDYWFKSVLFQISNVTLCSKCRYENKWIKNVTLKDSLKGRSKSLGKMHRPDPYYMLFIVWPFFRK